MNVQQLDLMRLVIQLEGLGVEVPVLLRRTLEVFELADATERSIEKPVLEMSEADLREYVEAVSLRRHATRSGNGVGLEPGIERVKAQAVAELRAGIVPDLDTIIEGLRPKFDEIVAPFLEAARLGLSYEFTTSDDLVREGNTEKLQVWRQVGQSWRAITRIARLRTQLSEAFDVAPTWAEAQQLGARDSGRRDWTVCFAAGDHWSMDGSRGYIERGKPALSGIDWIAIAASGGLRLNTASEVREKIVERVHKRNLATPEEHANAAAEEAAGASGEEADGADQFDSLMTFG